VLDAQVEHIKEIEGDITKWLHMEMAGNPYKAALLAVRARMAKYINAPLEDTVLIDNASNGINVLLRSWQFKPNEVLLDFTTAYGPFKAFYAWLGATRGVEVVTVNFTFPLSGPADITAAFEETLSVLHARGKSVGVAVVSQVSSAPAIVLPATEIVQAMRDAGIPSIVDGAHALGAVNIDINAMAPDFWFGNGHKVNMVKQNKGRERWAHPPPPSPFPSPSCSALLALP
jgi:selenocysteine lyase/cysteine desulfurase